MAVSTRTRRGGSGVLLALGLAVAAALLSGPAVGPAAAAERGLAAWTGGVNLYRSGTFTTQQSWLWCTAAGVQIVRNIVERDEDHSTSAQRRYFDWMRERNRYDLPLSAGVDPVGWTAGLRRFVDSRYQLVSSRTFDGALRSAVKRLRLTGLPVALAVSRGNHGWILTGFRATADPARTRCVRGHQRPRRGAAVRAAERERLRHAAEHEADDERAAALLHAVAIRAEADDLGRAVRVDPARSGGDGLHGRDDGRSRAEPGGPKRERDGRTHFVGGGVALGRPGGRVTGGTGRDR